MEDNLYSHSPLPPLSQSAVHSPALHGSWRGTLQQVPAAMGLVIGLDCSQQLQRAWGEEAKGQLVVPQVVPLVV